MKQRPLWMTQYTSNQSPSFQNFVQMLTLPVVSIDPVNETRLMSKDRIVWLLVRAVSLYVDGEEKTRWILFVASRSIRASRRRLLHVTSFWHYHGFPQRVLRSPTPPGDNPLSTFHHAVVFHRQALLIIMYALSNSCWIDMLDQHVLSEQWRELLRVYPTVQSVISNLKGNY